MTAARRPAAILAADVVGYSRLMGARGGNRTAVREHCEAQEVPDTLALIRLAKTHR
jgi:class 3 adenylate cyclase